MTRIVSRDYIRTGIVVDSESIRLILTDYRISNFDRGKGRIVSFETRQYGPFVEIMKQRSGYLGRVTIHGGGEYQAQLLNRILADICAVEIDPTIVTNEFNRIMKRAPETDVL